ncbi:MAG: XRE family transcriptional regulator [Caulobacter sp.]
MSPQEKLDAGKRIAAARKALKPRLTQVQLAEALGLSQSVISDWETGTLESWADCEADVERLLKVPRGYIRDQVVVSDQVEMLPAPEVELVYVGEYDVRLSAGPGFIVDAETIRRVWPLPRFLFEQLGIDPRNATIQEVIGDSMAPTLRSGDFTVLDLADKRIGNPGVFAVWDGDALVCKRVERIPGEDTERVKLKSDNPLHGEYTVPADRVNIVGRVRWVISRL